MKTLTSLCKQVLVILMLLPFVQALANSTRLQVRRDKISRLAHILSAFAILLVCSSAVYGTEIPPAGSIVQLQTNGSTNARTNGDWYTNTNGGNGYHYFELYIPPLWPAATPIHVDLFSPEMNCNSSLDEQDGTTPGNTQFEIYNVGTIYNSYATPGPGAVGSLQQSAYPPVGAKGNCTNQPAETWVRFYTIAAPVTPGTYLLRVQTSGNNQNGWRLRFNPDNDSNPTTPPPVGLDNQDGIPGTADELGIGVLQASYQHNATGIQCVDQYQVVAGNLANITFNNFDMEGDPNTVTYYAPNGASIEGTESENELWNNGGTATIRVGDTIANPANGIWRARTCFDANNQIIQEMRTGEPYFLEGPNVPAMTLRKDDGTDTVALGQPTTYTLSFTNEIDPLSYSGAAVNAQLVDTLPAGVTYNGCAINPPYNGPGSSCSESGGVVTYTLDPAVVPSGGSGSVTLTVTSNTNNSFTNTAQMNYKHQWGLADYTVTATDTNNPPLQVTKTSDATNPLLPSNTVNYTVQITNTSATTQTGIVVNDALPAGTTYVAQSTVATGYANTTTTATFADNFSSGNYSGNSANFSGSWTEFGDDNQYATNSNGSIRLSNGNNCQSDYCLRINLSDSNSVNDYIYRELDLSDYSSATLSYYYDKTNGYGTVQVQVSSDGGTNWTTVRTHTSSGSGTINSIPITTSIASNTRIRFLVFASTTVNNSRFYADNIQISAQSTTLSAITKDNIPGGANPDLTNGAPPSLVTAADGFQLGPNQSMTVTYRATVNSPPLILPQNIINTAQVTSTQQTQPLTATVSDPVFTADIGDQVWLDADGDGIKDVGEAGLANVKVVLYRAGVPVNWTLTGTDGHYLFPNLVPGSYTVGITTSTLPSGLTLTTGTNPTASITVNGASTQYLNADFGYRNTAAGTATIGDMVWSDANGNGVREAGESGLNGVTMRLWQDANGNGSYDSGEQVATTTTDANGTYRFTGVAPGTYRVTADTTNILSPAGYTLAYPTGSTVVIAVAAGDNALNADFGYRNPALHSITDTIWSDTDNDGVKDAGEVGLAGVTVNLRANGGIIATAVTGADGSFTFPGLANGSYTLEIADTAGVLAGTSGTTAAAIAGRRDVTLSGSDVTGTSFGYNQPGAIGNQVFVDSNSNGVQDPGEPGISGVTVRLYNSSGAQIATTTTAADGSYLFTGQPAGNYTVKINSTQSALGGYSPLNGTPNGFEPDDREIAVNLATASSSSLAADFRYSSASSGSVSGTVWSDTNRNANLETGEPGLGGVTVVLLNSGGSVVATTTTNSSGAYTFNNVPDNNVPDGSYTVKVTDSSNLLLNYSSTTGGDTRTVTISGAVVADINFGYYKPTPTYALLSDFRAYALSGVPVIEWRTAGETGTLGFDLYRKDVDQPDESAFVQLNPEMLPALIDAPQGGAYYFVDHGAQIGQTYAYRLVEHEVDAKDRDKERNLGVHTVRIEAQTPADANITLAELVDDYARTARAPSAQEATRSQAARNAKREAKAKKRQKKSSDLAKLYVKEPGLYRVDATELATLLNIDAKEAKKQIGKYGYQLTSQGRDVAYHAADDNSALYFYNPGYDSVYTSTNVFWLGLSKKAGVPMAVVDGVPSTKPKQPKPPVPTGAETFQRTLEFEENHAAALGSGLYGPEDNYWMWNYLVTSQPGLSTKTYSVTAPGIVAASPATLTLELLGGNNDSANPDHHLVVALNGSTVGETRWDGIAKQTLDLTLSPGTLQAGDNTLILTAVKDAGVSLNVIYLDRFTLKYSSQYQAANDRLAFNSVANNAIQISGFSTAPVVVSLSDPWNPVWVNVTGQAVAGGYGVTLNPASANTPYWAAASSAVPEVENAWTDAPSQLKDVPLDADYLVIAPEEVKPAAQALADYRKTKGFSTAVVDLEDIMDEFNHGLSSPKAIRDFLTQAYTQWKVPPRFVVLAGAGSYDYQNYLGYNDSLIPPLMVQTLYGLAASDNHLGDVAGDDGLPDITIGRIPAVNNAELQAYVDKVKAYESAGAESWAQQSVFVADNADAGGNFPADTDDLAALVPAANQASRVYLGTAPYQTASLARAGVLNALNQGAAYFSYLGHGNPAQLANEKLLLQSDVAGLTNGGRLPVALFLTCKVADFSLPGYDSLGEMLVLKGSGGAAAVWGPTGLSLNSGAKQLADGFFAETFRMGNRVLGEAVAGAYQHYGAGHSRFMLDIYTILGDPALQMK